MTVGNVGAGKRDLRGTGASRGTGDCGPGSTHTALWKLGRKSRGGNTGGVAEERFDRCVLVDV